MLNYKIVIAFTLGLANAICWFNLASEPQTPPPPNYPVLQSLAIAKKLQLQLSGHCSKLV